MKKAEPRQPVMLKQPLAQKTRFERGQLRGLQFAPVGGQQAIQLTAHPRQQIGWRKLQQRGGEFVFQRG